MERIAALEVLRRGLGPAAEQCLPPSPRARPPRLMINGVDEAGGAFFIHEAIRATARPRITLRRLGRYT